MEEKKLAEKIRNSKNLLVTIEECLAHRDSKAKREAKKRVFQRIVTKKCLCTKPERLNFGTSTSKVY